MSKVCIGHFYGSCLNGSACRYNHELADRCRRDRICVRFAAGVGCKFGDRCRQRHVSIPDSCSTPSAVPRGYRGRDTGKRTFDAAAVQAAASEVANRLLHHSEHSDEALADSARSFVIPAPPARAAGSPTPLFIDALNFGTEMCPLNDWCLARICARVQTFVAAARASGYEPAAFIDARAPTAEASAKWVTRREAEVAKGERNMPQGWSAFLGEAYRAAGVPVYYSVTHDNDDTLAAYAHAHGAAVLSADRDLLRYRVPRTGAAPSYSLFKGFELVRSRTGAAAGAAAGGVGGRAHGGAGAAPSASPQAAAAASPSPSPSSPPPFTLRLIAQDAERNERTSLRDLPLRPLPSVRGEEGSLLDALETRTYTRGAPSPLIRLLGRNPHEDARPLRGALMRLLLERRSFSDLWLEDFRSGVVDFKEKLPVWDAASGAVAWREADLRVPIVPEASAADAAAAEPAREAEYRRLVRLLQGNPRDAIAAFFPAEAACLPGSSAAAAVAVGAAGPGTPTPLRAALAAAGSPHDGDDDDDDEGDDDDGDGDGDGDAAVADLRTAFAALAVADGVRVSGVEASASATPAAAAAAIGVAATAASSLSATGSGSGGAAAVTTTSTSGIAAAATATGTLSLPSPVAAAAAASPRLVRPPPAGTPLGHLSPTSAGTPLGHLSPTSAGTPLGHLSPKSAKGGAVLPPSPAAIGLGPGLRLPSKIDWFKHVFACASVVVEMCAAASGSSYMREMMALGF